MNFIIVELYIDLRLSDDIRNICVILKEKFGFGNENKIFSGEVRDIKVRGKYKEEEFFMVLFLLK